MLSEYEGASRLRTSRNIPTMSPSLCRLRAFYPDAQGCVPFGERAAIHGRVKIDSTPLAARRRPPRSNAERANESVEPAYSGIQSAQCMPPERPSKAFISYSHESEHKRSLSRAVFIDVVSSRS